MKLLKRFKEFFKGNISNALKIDLDESQKNYANLRELSIKLLQNEIEKNKDYYQKNSSLIESVFQDMVDNGADMSISLGISQPVTSSLSNFRFKGKYTSCNILGKNNSRYYLYPNVNLPELSIIPTPEMVRSSTVNQINMVGMTSIHLLKEKKNLFFIVEFDLSRSVENSIDNFKSAVNRLKRLKGDDLTFIANSSNHTETAFSAGDEEDKPIMVIEFAK